jgi:aspartate aminotransferase
VYRTLLDPGDLAVYPVPSWNNNHYAYLAGARAHEIAVHAKSNFFPRAEDIAPAIHEARMITINSPLNPTGTVIDRGQLEAIATLVVEENARRVARGERRLVYLVYDQVYWMLTFHGAEHVTPVELVPEVGPYTVLLDGASKAFCATGMRVGWGVMPPAIRRRMADILGHIGAWAPRAEQIAMAHLLDAPESIAAFHHAMHDALARRLDALHTGFRAMAADGYPVEAIAPQGAIYLSARFPLIGRTVCGRSIRTNDDIRALLLEEAGLAVVPFQAFGLREETGWFRLSVGAVSVEDIHAAIPRLRALLDDVRG